MKKSSQKNNPVNHNQNICNITWFSDNSTITSTSPSSNNNYFFSSFRDQIITDYQEKTSKRIKKILEGKREELPLLINDEDLIIKELAAILLRNKSDGRS